MEEKEGLGLLVEDRRRKKTYVLRFTFYALRITVHVSLYLFFIARLIGTASGLTEERTIDYVIAVVNDQPITLRELETELIVREVEQPPNPVKRAVLEELIERKLMLQKADDMGIPLGRWGEKVNAEIEAIKAEYTDEALFLEELKLSGLEYQELEEWLRNDLIVRELIVRQFRSSIDDEQINQEAAQYFEQNRSEFVEPVLIQFQYILVFSKPEDTADLQTRAKKLAETIVSELKAGTTFREVQQAYSDNPFLLVAEEPQTLTASTEAGLAVADLETDEVSQPIPISEGYLIARLLEKKLPRQKTYPEVSQGIKEQLIRKELEKQRKAWLAEQKEAGDIRILDAELAQIRLENTNAGEER